MLAQATPIDANHQRLPPQLLAPRERNHTPMRQSLLAHSATQTAQGLDIQPNAPPPQHLMRDLKGGA